MDHLSFKEKVASVFCVIFSFVILCSGLYDFLIVDTATRELILSVGVFLLLLSAGLTPKMFFSPLAEIFKGEAFPSIVNFKLPQWFSLFGILCCGIGLVSF
ncbi:MAG: hypothetical protein CMK64_01875 [Pseudoalteromonas sp.]|nr:hypothetical protein [Pseudoalteromonas sp.]